MTTPKASELGIIAVVAPPVTTSPSAASQLGIIAVVSGLVPSKASQLGITVVSGFGKKVMQMNPVIQLGCWSPCGTLAHNYYRRD